MSIMPRSNKRVLTRPEFQQHMINLHGPVANTWSREELERLYQEHIDRVVHSITSMEL